MTDYKAGRNKIKKKTEESKEMFPCTSHGDAALLELPRGGRRPAFLCKFNSLISVFVFVIPHFTYFFLSFRAVVAVSAQKRRHQTPARVATNGNQNIFTPVQTEQHVERRLPHLHVHTLRVTLFIC